MVLVESTTKGQTVGSLEVVNVRTAKYWEIRAEEARTRASEMHDSAAIATMLDIALRYDRMARRIAERSAPNL